MVIKVMDRVSARKYSYDPNVFPTAMISIHTPGDQPNNISLEHGVKDVLHLSFYDVETDRGIIEEDAKAIAEFVLKNKDKYDVLIVHCDAGISRSAGVAAAIMKYLCNDDSKIFNSLIYSPNFRCYRYVLNALIDTDNNNKNNT